MASIFFKDGNNKFINLLSIIYPVGSVYISTDSTSPATIIGGTWTQVQNKFTIASDSNHTAGTFGESGASLSMPVPVLFSENNGSLKVHWPIYNYNFSSYDSMELLQLANRSYAYQDFQQYGNQANMEKDYDVKIPYFAINIWYRTA